MEIDSNSGSHLTCMEYLVPDLLGVPIVIETIEQIKQIIVD